MFHPVFSIIAVTLLLSTQSVTQSYGEAIHDRIFDEELGRWLSPLEIGKEVVYLTEDKALELLLPHSETIRAENRVLTPEKKSCIENRIGWKFPETSFKFFIGETGGTIDGYASIQNTIGKYRPMTYMVGITSSVSVSQVEMLIYRESRGAEIRKPRFMHQYKGKKSDDPIRINRDIINSTGATMSVRSMSAGIKRALVLTEELYLNPPEMPCSAVATRKKQSRSFFDRLFGK
tara:strand:- start:759 stop:1457 length:699 start_codon:yes stop_codon:yes gene_type:complete